MYSSIKQRKIQLDKKKKLNDAEMISHFVNEISMPKMISNGKSFAFSGNIVQSLSKFARNLI